jgi:Putative peptidoglycan binding domain
MKTTKLFGLITTALVSLSQPAWPGPHVGGGGFGGGGHFGGGHFAGNPGGIRAAPAFSGGARLSGRNLGGFNRVPQQFSYYGGARASAVRPHGFTASVPRSVSPNVGNQTAITRQPSRAGSMAARNRVSGPQASRATNRGSFNTNRAFARHDANWHRDWDKRRAHFDHRHVFVFVNGFWYGFYPWDYYPYYGYGDGYYPYDYSYDYPYDSYNYDEYPYDSYNDSGSYPYSYYNGYAPSGQSGNGAVSAVQSRLQTLGYYRGAIDGILGDETEAALARYQQDKGLSVTGTVTAATLQALGLPNSAGF